MVLILSRTIVRATIGRQRKIDRRMIIGRQVKIFEDKFRPKFRYIGKKTVIVRYDNHKNNLLKM